MVHCVWQICAILIKDFYSPENDEENLPFINLVFIILEKMEQKDFNQKVVSDFILRNDVEIKDVRYLFENKNKEQIKTDLNVNLNEL